MIVCGVLFLFCRERRARDREMEEEEEAYERRKLEKKIREKELAYQEVFVTCYSDLQGLLLWKLSDKDHLCAE